MIERIIITLVVVAFGVAAYSVFKRLNLRRAANAAPTDPILNDLKPGVPTVVYFTTPGCIPCQTQQQPALAKLKTELGEGVQVVRVDAVEDPEAADRWGVFSAPTTFILDKRGQPLEVNHGVADAEKLRRQVEIAAV